MKLTKEQEDFLDDVVIDGTWYLNEETGLVDVDGTVSMTVEYIKYGEIPVNFGYVTGSFDCYDCGLINLEGTPHTVGADFSCSDNRLTSLKGSPHTVGGDFYCTFNNLTTLEGAPKTVGGYLYGKGNPLNSLEGAPHNVGGRLYVGLPNKQSEHYDKFISQLITLIDFGVVKNKEDYQTDIDAWLGNQMLKELNSGI